MKKTYAMYKSLTGTVVLIPLSLDAKETVRLKDATYDFDASVDAVFDGMDQHSIVVATDDKLTLDLTVPKQTDLHEYKR